MTEGELLLDILQEAYDSGVKGAFVRIMESPSSDYKIDLEGNFK